MAITVSRLTLSMEIFFKSAVLHDNAAFAEAFDRHGFKLSYGTPESPVMARGAFTVRLGKAPRVRGRAINVAALSVAPADVPKFIDHITSVKDVLAGELGIDLRQEFRSCSLIANAWVRTGNMSDSVLGGLKDIDGIDELKEFTSHRTPFEKLEFVSGSPQGLLDYDEWQKMEIDSTPEGEYLMSLHYNGTSLEGAAEYLGKADSRIRSVIGAIESKVMQA
jgi:hypothetical protein